MMTKVLLVLAALLVLFLVVAAFQSPEYRVTRSITVDAPAAVAFQYVNDLHKWQEISPYVKLDPAAKYTFEGPVTGPGASLAWTGNSQVGEGKMTITEVRQHQLVAMRLDFLKPFAAVCATQFTFEPNGNQTRVTWNMAGKKVYITKVMGMVMSMDKMIGTQFEEGLATLKTLSEAAAKTASR